MEASGRAKVTRTALALGSYLFHGMNNGVLGPSILDIAALTQSSNLQAASCLTWRSIGTLGGLLTTGHLYDRFNEHFLLGVTMFIMAATVLVAPLCTDLAFMYLFLVVNGVMQGSATVGHTGLPVKIWGAEKCGPVVQAIHLMSSLGSAIIPLILAPFLINSDLHFIHGALNRTESVKRSIHSGQNPATPFGGTPMKLIEDLLAKQLAGLSSAPKYGLSSAPEPGNGVPPLTINRTLDGPWMGAPGAIPNRTLNLTATGFSNSTATATTPSWISTLSVVNSTLGLNNLEVEEKPELVYIPRLHYGYAVLAAGLFLVSACHFIFAQLEKGNNQAKKKQHGVATPVFHPWLVLFIFFWLGYFNGAIETVYGEVVQPFLDRYLGWSARSAAFLISVFWFGQGAGRFVGIPIAKYVGPDKMLLGNTLTVIAAAVAIQIFIQSSASVWVCTVLIAIGLSTERGCEVSWLALLIPFRGINNGILFCGIYAGKGFTPVLYGALSRVYGQIILMYMGLVMSITMTFVVVICIACVKYRTPQTTIKLEEESEKMLYSSEINENGQSKVI